MNYLREKTRSVRERGARDRAAAKSGNIASGLRVIPPAAWIVAFLAYLAFVLLTYQVFLPHDKAMSLWQDWQKLLFATGVPLFLIPYVLLIGYIYGDAKRRRMRHVMWMLLAIFIPNLIGVLLYFLLRDPLPAPCPKCGKVADGTYTFCPHCGTELARSCAVCHRMIEPGWDNCAYCGTKLSLPQVPAS